MRKIANPTRRRRNLTFSRLGYEIISKKRNYSRTTQAKSIKKAVPIYNYKHGVSCLYSKTSTWVFDKTKSRRLESAVATVSNDLWYLDSHHQLLQDTFAALCDDLNYETSHKRHPKLRDSVYTDVGRTDERTCGQPAWVVASNVDCSSSVPVYGCSPVVKWYAQVLQLLAATAWEQSTPPWSSGTNPFSWKLLDWYFSNWSCPVSLSWDKCWAWT